MSFRVHERKGSQDQDPADHYQSHTSTSKASPAGAPSPARPARASGPGAIDLCIGLRQNERNQEGHRSQKAQRQKQCQDRLRSCAYRQRVADLEDCEGEHKFDSQRDWKDRHAVPTSRAQNA
eukprot:CAMPEP_0170640044 /NCGR_PEP_ID=MMETSP0224-20130122/39991_1 /TAXON_ID=285029 /ORGANISM="Togula jolla, Strain CCCM 725" /LENGTH=121 /DNA_ID=CAMNT_0010970477 /DNA_START=99 /DNA_END=460 /DNA_ORIENTATION=-